MPSESFFYRIQHGFSNGMFHMDADMVHILMGFLWCAHVWLVRESAGSVLLQRDEVRGGVQSSRGAAPNVNLWNTKV